MDPFEKFWPLVLDPDQEMTADERASLEYYSAFTDVTAMARRLRRLMVELGRPPVASDPGAEPLLAWLDEQRSSDLNSYQRTHLAWIGPWTLEA